MENVYYPYTKNKKSEKRLKNNTFDFSEPVLTLIGRFINEFNSSHQKIPTPKAEAKIVRRAKRTLFGCMLPCYTISLNNQQLDVLEGQLRGILEAVCETYTRTHTCIDVI